jgi:hypothetical protein
MESRANFDLNRALDAWKQQLAAHPEISGEDARELEGHLLECFESERRQGYPDQEAFARALRQIGELDNLGAEYVKINPFRTWPHRVALMVFAGVITWAWTSVTQTLSGVLQVFGYSGLPGLITVAVVLNGALPLVLLTLVLKGQGKSLLRGFATLFSNRWLLLGCSVGLALLVNLAAVWIVWNHSEPEKIFGPSGKANLSAGLLLWQYYSALLAWPGPIVALLVWLAPFAHRTISAAAAAQNSEGHARQLVFWMAAGYVALSCFGALSGAAYPLLSGAALWLFQDAETLFRITRSVLLWVPNLVLCLLVAVAIHGKWARRLHRLELTGRWAVATGGVFCVLFSYGVLAVSLSSTPYWLMFEAPWTLAFIGYMTWLWPTAVGPKKVASVRSQM